MTPNHCEPNSLRHRTPLPALDSHGIAEHMERLDGWQLDDIRLVKNYHFDDAVLALDFVNRVGAEAEARNHHPHVHWWKRDVRVELWTHKSNGLTTRDFEFAAWCDPGNRD